MHDEDSKTFAKCLFEGLGYTVKRIPESRELNEKRADLEATYKNEIVIIEAKGKEPHQAYKELLKEANSNGLATCSRKIIPWSALSSVIKKATLQLQATPAPQEAPRIFFISCIHYDWSYVLDAFKYCLYGEVELSLWRDTDSLPDLCGIKPCFYYLFSEFRQYPILDAVVLGGLKGFMLLINEFGEHKSYIRKSQIYSKAQNTNSLCDPEILRDKGEALSILSKKRLNETECWQYILDTYGYKSSLMSRYQFNGLVVLDLNTIME